MKKIIPILSIALVLILVSCEKQFGFGNDLKQELAPDATLTLGFGVPQDAATKAATMADEPTIETIHVFVFDGEGRLLQVQKAECGNVTRNYGEEGATTAQTVSWWRVNGIMMANEKRVLHFVANLADDKVPTYGSETTIFQSLATAYPYVSYWQRVELPNIIPYVYKGGGKYDYVDDETGEYKTNVDVKLNATIQPNHADDWSWYIDEKGFQVNEYDYIDAKSRKIVNGTGYYASKETSSYLTRIRLVRNFARIKFENQWTDFTVNKIALVNMPNAGLVAPFSGGSFPAAYTGVSDDPLDVTALSGYKPLLPGEGINTGLDNEKHIALPVAQPYTDADGFVAVGADQKATLFVFERDIPTSSPTSVLVGGLLGGRQTWFKIEIAKEDGSYFPIYRDFTYNLTIESIDASATKHTSAENALKSAPVGDISNSDETATLTQISDGNGLTLWVQYIDKIILSGEMTTVPLLYTFMYNDGDDTYYFNDNDHVAFAWDQNPNFTTLDPATTETVTTDGPIDSSSDYWPDSWDDSYEDYQWYVALVTLNSISDSSTPVLKSDIVVTGEVKVTDETHYARKLSRRVAYTVMGPQDLTLRTSGVESNAAGQEMTLSIKLPDTFGPSVFPMTLKIEAEDNNLTPVDNLSVEYGKSAFRPDASTNTYYFLKTISYSEYKAAKGNQYVFPCVFKTTKATGKTPVTRIRVTQKLESNTVNLFNVATVNLNIGSEATSTTN